MKKWDKNHVFGIKDFTKEEIESVFETADSFKELSLREVKKAPALRGKTVVNLFFENSTRTRTSFELAAKRLSADVLNFSSSSSSLIKGESIVDTVKTLESYRPDILVLRVGYSTCLHNLCQFTRASIVNAGDGSNEHPTQALLDMFTVREKIGEIKNLSVLIVGDILHSRVARSNIFGFKKFGCRLRVCGPPTLIPFECEKMGVEVCHNFDRAAEEADVIIMLRIQKERQSYSFIPSLREYTDRFSLTRERMRLLKKSCLILHPGPVNWGVEISSQLKEEIHPLILRQVENGLAVRMAVLYLIGTKKKKSNERVN